MSNSTTTALLAGILLAAQPGHTQHQNTEFLTGFDDPYSLTMHPQKSAVDAGQQHKPNVRSSYTVAGSDAESSVSQNSSLGEISTVWPFGVLVAIPSLALLILLLRNRKRAALLTLQATRERKKRELLESELLTQKLLAEELQKSLEAKQSDLTDFAIDLSQKRQFADELVVRLDQIRKSDDDTDKGLRILMMELRGQQQLEEKNKVLQANVDTVGREFFDNLQQQFPDLTRTERELCSLIRLGRTNKEIATVRNITPNAVKVGRYRLRKKLGLEPADDITAFLTTF